MIITDKILQLKYLEHVGDGKAYSFFKVLHTGDLSFDQTCKSRVYIAYVGGNWYAYNGSRRKSSVQIPEEGKELFAYGNDCFWMRTKDMGVDVYIKEILITNEEFLNNLEQFDILLDNDFDNKINKYLADGLSYPAARQKAFDEYG